MRTKALIGFSYPLNIQKGLKNIVDALGYEADVVDNLKSMRNLVYPRNHPDVRRFHDLYIVQANLGNYKVTVEPAQEAYSWIKDKIDGRIFVAVSNDPRIVSLAQKEGMVSFDTGSIFEITEYISQKRQSHVSKLYKL